MPVTGFDLCHLQAAEVDVRGLGGTAQLTLAVVAPTPGIIC